MKFPLQIIKRLIIHIKIIQLKSLMKKPVCSRKMQMIYSKFENFIFKECWTNITSIYIFSNLKETTFNFTFVYLKLQFCISNKYYNCQQ
jgi:hypothetical protein